MSIYGNAVGGITGFGKTFVLEDENGNELTGVVVGEEVIFTADPVKDIREGKVAATDQGVVTGQKDIPAYRTNAGMEIVLPGSSFSISLPRYNQYDYTVFQCMVSLANMNDLDSSVETNKISINDSVYEVNSTVKLSDVLKNGDTKSIDLNIINNSENFYVIHYFTYRQEV